MRCLGAAVDGVLVEAARLVSRLDFGAGTGAPIDLPDAPP